MRAQTHTHTHTQTHRLHTQTHTHTTHTRTHLHDVLGVEPQATVGVGTALPQRTHARI